jgi:hypothetical protein
MSAFISYLAGLSVEAMEPSPIADNLVPDNETSDPQF